MARDILPTGGLQVMAAGILFFVGLLVLVCLFLRRAYMIEMLEHHGVTVVARVTRVEQHAVFTKVTAYWQHPRTRQVYPFHGWIVFNPLSLQPGSRVRFLVDPDNSQRYCMKA